MFVKHAVLYLTCLARHERCFLLPLGWGRKTWLVWVCRSLFPLLHLQQVSCTLGLIYHRVFVLWSLSRVHLTENRLVIGAQNRWIGTQNVLPKFSTTVLSTIGCCYSRTHAVVVTMVLEHKQYYIKYNFRLHWSLSFCNLLHACFILFEHVRQAC
jgi:hypothetical protein